jgi:hypothetical protein
MGKRVGLAADPLLMWTHFHFVGTTLIGELVYRRYVKVEDGGIWRTPVTAIGLSSPQKSKKYY